MESAVFGLSGQGARPEPASPIIAVRPRAPPCALKGGRSGGCSSTIPGDRFFRFDGRACVRSGPGAVEAKEPEMTEEVHYLNSVQAGRLLGLAPKTLARYRCTGTGPVFCRFGNRVRYRREDLEAWAETRRRASTVDDGTVLAGATP
jgi:hypothetical protein